MVHQITKQPANNFSKRKILQRQIVGSSKLVALGFLESFAALAYLCDKYSRIAYHKLANVSLKPSNIRYLIGIKKRSNGEKSFRDGWLWRQTILMGDKCQPLDFSGVIYYDSDGNEVFEPPMKSPRATASPLRIEW